MSEKLWGINNMQTKPLHERYDRQEKIQGWNQKLLSDARVVVVGAGAIGNEVIKNLCMSGVGNLIIIDDDIIEISNLSRTVLFKEDDFNKQKALTASYRAKELNPDINVDAIAGNIFYDVGLGIYRKSNLVIGALDNNAARLQLGISCLLAGTPYLDGAMWAFGGEVRWFLNKDGACFECTLSEEDKKYLHERRSCTGYKTNDQNTYPIPTTVSTTSVIGGILTQEAVKYLLGWKIKGSEAIVFDGRAMTMHRSTLSPNPKCPNHNDPYDNIIELKYSPDDITPKDLIKMACEDSQIDSKTLCLELSRDFLPGFYCKSCDTYEEIAKIISKVDESSRICSKCGKIREANIVSHVADSDPYSDKPLSYFGIPKGEILAVRSDHIVGFYELIF